MCPAPTHDRLWGVSPEDRAAVLANALDKDQFLEETYTPLTITKARKLTEQRKAGRQLLLQEIGRSVNTPRDMWELLGKKSK